MLSGAVNVPLVVWNPLAHNRTDIVTAELDHDFTGVVRDVDGTELPTLIENNRVSWLAEGVGSLGWQGYRLDTEGRGSRWEPHDGVTIGTDRHRVTVDPDRGGGVSSLITDGREWIAAGCVGNELAVYDEYPAHPQAGEGPWHLRAAAARAGDHIGRISRGGPAVAVCAR